MAVIERIEVHGEELGLTHDLACGATRISTRPCTRVSGIGWTMTLQNEHHARLLKCPICGENAKHRPLDPGEHDQFARRLADMTRPERMAPDALLVNE